MPIPECKKLNKQLQEHAGSLNWLSNQTRLDIATITNIIAHYNSKCSPGHIESAKYAIRYLKGTQRHSICFSSRTNNSIESFVQFPLSPKEVHALTDSNWGLQDQSVAKETDDPVYLELFKSCSITRYLWTEC